jgi:hypothetical protein
MDPRLFEIYTANRVPWQILKTMADDGWTDVGSVAARFLTAEAVHERAATSLQLEKWGPKQLEVALARLVAAQEDLSLHKQHKQKLKTNPMVSQVVEDTDRKTMETAFTENTTLMSWPFAIVYVGKEGCQVCCKCIIILL